jgi:IgGFc binding protein
MSGFRQVTGAGLLLVTAGFLACGKDRSQFDTPGGSFDTDAGPDVGSSAPECTGRTTCSRDLRSVVDACDESKVITECAAQDGCAGGVCVPACSVAVSSGASIGCEFVAVPPTPSGLNDEGSCFAAFFANTWATSARVEAEYDGKPLDVVGSGRIVRTTTEGVTYEQFSGELQPGEVVVLFLSQSPPTGGNTFTACPDGVTPAVYGETSIKGTGRGSSFRIKTTAPVSAYSMYPFGGAKSAVPSATLLLPVAAWKPGYVVVNAQELTVAAGTPARPTTQIVAAEDDTEVTIVGKSHIEGAPGIEGQAKGLPRTWALKRGEVIQLVQPDELTGSLISANKNIAVWGGHQCMLVPIGHMACDEEQFQLFPIQSWGREYAVVPHLSRLTDEIPEDYHYRIVAAVDGTMLTYEPSRPNGAPAQLGAGEMSFFTSRDLYVVRSQDPEHPIAVYAYMNGNSFQQATASDGDPETVPVIPAEQYLDRYVFFADPTYPSSQLVVVRVREEGKEFAAVTLDCAGPLEGWTPLGTSGKYESVRVRLTKKGAPQQIGTGTCGAGRHEIKSSGPFGVTVWGTAFVASYGYPGGSAIRKLNSVETIVR